MKFSGNCFCCDPPALCVIFEDDFDPDTVGDEWTLEAGDWEIDFVGRLNTEDDDAMIYAEEGPPGYARQFHATIEASEEGATCGLMVCVEDADNYIYVKVLFPVGETTPFPPSGDGVQGSITVIEVVGGTETVAQPATLGPVPGTGIGSVALQVCVIEGKNGNLPVVQVATDYFPYVHACISAIPGGGCGYRTDSLLGGTFDAVGLGMSLRHNWPADSAQAQGNYPPHGLGCQCYYRCANVMDTAQSPDCAITLAGWSDGSINCSRDPCDNLDGGYLIDATGQTWDLSQVSGSEDVYTCGWFADDLDLGVGIDNISISVWLDKDGPEETDEYRVIIEITGRGPGFCGRLAYGSKAIGVDKPTLDTLTVALAGADWEQWDAPGATSSLCQAAPGTATITWPSRTGCP